ncbi:MAG: hypothetical protein WA946_06765 [Nitrospirota bacterium]
MNLTNADIDWIFERMKNRCFYCGMKLSRSDYGSTNETVGWNIISFIPTSLDTDSQRCNLVTACMICDMVKGKLFPLDFDALKFRQGEEFPHDYCTLTNPA